MLSIDHYAVVDLDKPIKPETLDGVLGTFDSSSNKFRTKLCRGDTPIDLTDCKAVGYFTGEDGMTVRLGAVFNGTSDFSVPVTMNCLMKPGRFTLVIKIGKMQQETTVRIIHGLVQKTVEDDLWKNIQTAYVDQIANNKFRITVVPYVDVQRYRIFEGVDGKFEDSILNQKALLNGELSKEITVSGVGHHSYFVIPLIPDRDGNLTRGNVCGPYSQYLNANWDS